MDDSGDRPYHRQIVAIDLVNSFYLFKFDHQCPRLAEFFALEPFPFRYSDLGIDRISDEEGLFELEPALHAPNGLEVGLVLVPARSRGCHANRRNCIRAHEQKVTYLFLVDDRPAPILAQGKTIQTPYIDNWILLACGLADARK